MAAGYREFDDFAYNPPSTTPSNPQVNKYLREIEENVQHFVKNVDIIEMRTDLLNTKQDTQELREEIIQLVADTAQLAKITNSPIQKLRLQSRTLTISERNQFESLMTSFSSAGIKFKNLQRLTQNLEKELLNKSREARQRSSSSYSDHDTSGNPFGEDDNEKLINHNLQDDYHDRMAEQLELEQDASLLEEREQQMRQLETDIYDINDIFRDLGTMVHEQGEVIDNIEANVEFAATRVEAGNKQLIKAVKHKRCSRKLTLVIVCVLIIIVTAIIIGILILLSVFNVFSKHK